MRTNTTRPPAPAGKPGPLINRTFALLWGGEAISEVGDYLFDTTLVLWIAAVVASGRPWAPLAVSAALLAAALPRLVVRPITGVFVDRWDKRRTMLWMDAARAMLIALLAATTGGISLPS
jgi:MFS family permease